MMLIDFIISKSKIIVPLIIILVLFNSISGRSRWHYYPIYLLVIGYFILIILNYFKVVELSPALAKWIVGIGVFLIAITIVLILVFPKEKLPIASGKFEVGTRVFELEDKTRNEVYSVEANDKRKLKYQVWYPTDKTKEYKKAKWMFDGLELTSQLATSMNMLPFMLNHTAEISSNSYLDAPINNSMDKYPLVIISHGWRGFRELHTDYAEELASHGYIAISIDHTYGSQAVKFKDGSLAYLKEEALGDLSNPSKYNSDANILVRTYGEDVASVLDDLELLNKNNPDFKNKLNLDQIGLLGHSTGGGGHVYISLKENDTQIKALLGLDAWVKPVLPEILNEGLSIPSLFIRSQEWSKGPNNTALYLLLESSKDASLIQMDKTKHVDFTMAYMYSPLLKFVGFSGKLGGRESIQIQKKIILDFFDKHLRNKDEGDKKYLEEIVDKYESLKIIH